MLTSISQVNGEFFKLFFGTRITVDGKEISIPNRYSKKSSRDYVEEQDNQIYPCIATLDYTPVPKEEWFVDMKTNIEGYSSDNLRAYILMKPIWMEFKYDVSIASKSYKEHVALQDYFLKTFVYGKRFIFDKRIIEGDVVGDIVPYKIRTTDIPRTDGVFETNYEFTLSVWLYVADVEDVETVQTLMINYSAENLPQ